MKSKFWTLIALLSSFFVSHPSFSWEQTRGTPEKSDYALFVTVKVKPEKTAEFRQALLSIVDQSRAEEGNLAYNALQLTNDATEFAVYEHWASDEAHKNHLAAPFFIAYSKTVTPMIEPGYPIRKKYIALE